MTVTVDKKPIVVPDSIRRKAGLRPGDKIDFKVSGREITIVPKKSVWDDDETMRIIEEAIEEEKRNPMSREELLAVTAELQAYGAKQAKKLGIKERDIPRIIHEYRAERRRRKS